MINTLTKDSFTYNIHSRYNHMRAYPHFDPEDLDPGAMYPPKVGAKEEANELKTLLDSE